MPRFGSGGSPAIFGPVLLIVSVTVWIQGRHDSEADLVRLVGVQHVAHVVALRAERGSRGASGQYADLDFDLGGGRTRREDRVKVDDELLRQGGVGSRWRVWHLPGSWKSVYPPSVLDGPSPVGHMVSLTAGVAGGAICLAWLWAFVVRRRRRRAAAVETAAASPERNLAGVVMGVVFFLGMAALVGASGVISSQRSGEEALRLDGLRARLEKAGGRHEAAVVKASVRAHIFGSGRRRTTGPTHPHLVIRFPGDPRGVEVEADRCLTMDDVRAMRGHRPQPGTDVEVWRLPSDRGVYPSPAALARDRDEAERAGAGALVLYGAIAALPLALAVLVAWPRRGGRDRRAALG